MQILLYVSTILKFGIVQKFELGNQHNHENVVLYFLSMIPSANVRTLTDTSQAMYVQVT